MPHSKSTIRQNSVAAYREERREGRLSRRADEVLAIYRAARRPLRDRQVMERLGYVDPNKVRPSITTLIDKGILREVASVTDPVTNKTVRVVALVSYDTGQKQFEFNKSKRKT
jgi:hypothetical protein